MGKATNDLRNEHEAILFVLEILEKMVKPGGADFDKETLFKYFGEVVYFLKIFADKCHHGKEENYLFSELVKRGIPDEGGPVGVMLAEHAEGRNYIAKMAKSLDKKDIDGFARAANGYTDLLRRHIDKENNVLFVMADNVIGEDGQDYLYEMFEKHEENVVGQGVHEKLHAMIDNWAEAFGVGG